MTFPLAHTIGVRTFQSGATDAHGNPVESWAAPVSVAVHGISPGSDEPRSTNRDLSLIEWTVYAPAGTTVGPRDLVIVRGREFTVEGEVKDYTLGPWANPVAGVVFELRRAEG